VSSGFDGAYAYARVCGSLARSFLGERARNLATCARVGEAWRAVFGESPPVLPENELASVAEFGLRARATDAFWNIAGPPLHDTPFFKSLLRKWEFAHLKRVLAAIVEGSPSAPATGAASLEPDFDVQGFPDLGKMLRNTRYEWVAESGIDALPAVKNRLDRQYHAELWDSVATIPAGLRGSIPALLRTEAELENLVWGLRLKRYYSMDAAEIEPLLISLDGVDVKRPALRALALRSDSRQEWRGWKWERLVPDSRREDGGDWYFDVRGFEQAARGHLYRLLLRRLHFEPDGYVPLFAYFRIKEFEALAIHGIIEGIKLEAPAAEIGEFAARTTGVGA
jgi:vacuolar-type H+-ATPase subunit C/Vma6